MRIGLDWDGTVSADPIVFKEVVQAFLDGGHDVRVVTWRTPPDEATGWGSNGTWVDIEEIFAIWGFKIPVVYCSGRAKREYYRADVWIDDNPAAVVFSLTVDPRFEADPSAYNRDILVCERTGYEPVYVEWEQVKGIHDVPPIPASSSLAQTPKETLSA
jgi:hypothetical protein